MIDSEGRALLGPWPANVRFGPEGLEVAGVSAEELATQHGTPLFVVDEDDLRARCRAFRSAFPRVHYAVKAFTARSLIRVVVEEGLGLLAASGGELAACLRAGADPASIALHGNNKSDDELDHAVRAGVGLVVADNEEEIGRLSRIALALGRRQPMLLRVIPGVTAGTHSFIETGELESKFGTPVVGGAALDAVRIARSLPGVLFCGLHAHVGSQVPEVGPYLACVDSLLDLAAQVRQELGGDIRLLDLGGGFAAVYTDERPTDLRHTARSVMAAVREGARRRGLAAPRVLVEPGRSIAANAVLTLYRVGSVKRVPGMRSFVAVDGGMSDNIRPVLYGARYTLAPAGPIRGGSTEPFTVVGKHCESGDVLAADVELPVGIGRGDLLAMAATGAYGYSMASNYNRIGRPAVVAVRRGRARLWVRRETDEDLLRLDVERPDHLPDRSSRLVSSSPHERRGAAMSMELMVLGGERVPAAEGRMFEVIEPGTGAPMTEVAEAGAEDASRAVDVAYRAFEDGSWRRTSATERGRVLLRASFLLRERLEEFAVLEARNAGKPINAARGEMGTVAGVLEYWGGAANKIFGESIPVQDPGLDVTLREPVGVCALITPWNFPLVIASWKIGPALACGNTIVVKPATYTPLTVLMLADLLVEAGLPPETISVLPGPGRAVGNALVADPRVSKVGFTGSTSVGAQIMKLCADNITRVSLELGGKSANVVFADADLDVGVEKSMWSIFDNTGQDCTSRSRMFVERPVYDEFIERMAKRTSELRVGQPLEESTDLGPLISAGQRQTSLDYIQLGIEEGARLATGGEIPPEPAGGFYLRPAILADVDNAWRVAQEEIFGPVACVTPFDTEEEAIRLANATVYGLSGSVWTRDLGRAIRVAKEIRTGVVSVNSAHSVHTEAPFGGYKQSGIGREMGMHAVNLYTEIKNVYFSEL